MVNPQDRGKLVRCDEGLEILSLIRYLKIDGKRKGFAVINLSKGGCVSIDIRKVEVVR